MLISRQNVWLLVIWDKSILKSTYLFLRGFIIIKFHFFKKINKGPKNGPFRRNDQMVVLKILVVVTFPLWLFWRFWGKSYIKKDPHLVIFVFHSKKKKMKQIFRRNNRMVVPKILVVILPFSWLFWGLCMVSLKFILFWTTNNNNVMKSLTFNLTF